MMRAVIVSHGQPGDPGPQQQAIEDLAARVAACDPGCPVVGATLAMPGALAAVAQGDSLIYPMFMAEGWFTRTELPGLVVAQAHAAASAQGWTPQDTTLLLAAHGSQRSQASFAITTALAESIAPHFARVVTGFVEQEPFLADAARGLDRAVSLPFFALRAEHVLDDLPTALDQAGFTGPRLDPIGLAPEVPALIAASIRAAL